MSPLLNASCTAMDSAVSHPVSVATPVMDPFALRTCSSHLMDDQVTSSLLQTELEDLYRGDPQSSVAVSLLHLFRLWKPSSLSLSEPRVLRCRRCSCYGNLSRLSKCVNSRADCRTISTYVQALSTIHTPLSNVDCKYYSQNALVCPSRKCVASLARVGHGIAS